MMDVMCTLDSFCTEVADTWYFYTVTLNVAMTIQVFTIVSICSPGSVEPLNFGHGVFSKGQQQQQDKNIILWNLINCLSHLLSKKA